MTRAASERKDGAESYSMVREEDGRIRSIEQVQQAARRLRADATEAEAILWQALRNRRLDGYKFRRQHPLGTYVADFCCAASRVIVELDGAVHASQTDADADRTRALESYGYRVLRFRNRQVTDHLDDVLSTIREACAERGAG